LRLIENRLLREAPGRIFRKRADFLVVGSHESEGLSLEKISETECDVMVLDFLDARWLPIDLRSKASDCPEPKLLLISMNNDRDEFLKAVRRGVTGFLLKEASVSEVCWQLCGRRSVARRFARPNCADISSSTSVKVPSAGLPGR
jgi:DNA-binding NarL/FixJ family response regulator